MGKYVVFPEHDDEGHRTGQWMYRQEADNGEVLFVSEAYTRKADAYRAIGDVKASVLGAMVEEEDD